MTYSSLFAYPGSEARGQPDELTFLADWSDADWGKLLQHTEARRFRTGQELIRGGEADRALSIVVDGSLEVLGSNGRGRGTRRMALIDAGSVFGEIAFFDNKPRSATVRAVSDGRLLYLGFDAFEAFAAQEPELARDLLFNLGRILSVRLRQTSGFFTA